MFSILWVYFIYSVYVFFKTTMKPPFRMPLFVPLNPSPGSLVYWSVKPQRSMIFPAIDLHDPFVDVFFPYVLHLVGGWPTPLKNIWVQVNGKYDIPYMIENKIHVPVTTKQYMFAYL